MSEKNEKQIALIAVIVLAALLLVLGCVKIARIVRSSVSSSYDLGKLTAAETDQDGVITIGDDSYSPYCRAVYGDLHLTPGQLEVVAYREQLGQVGQITYLEYFARIDERPHGSWLVSFTEDGSGRPNDKTLRTVYCKAGTEGVPDWIAEMAAQAPPMDAASASDLADWPADGTK